MVRTKADGVKAAGAKCERKTFPSPAPRPNRYGAAATSKKSPFVGGNRYKPGETPEWQKPITTFFTSPQAGGKENGMPESDGSAASKVSLPQCEEKDKGMPESDGSESAKAPMENPPSDYEA